MPESPPRIDFENKKLVTGNNTYYVESETLSIRRFRIYQDISMELAQASTWKSNMEAWQKIYKDTTSGNDIIKALHTVQTEAYNQINSASNITAERFPAIIRFATLFLNTKDEDLTDYDTKHAEEKMNDWEQSGVPIQDFFLLARTLIDGYEEFLKSLSKIEEQVRPAQKKTTASNLTKKPTDK